MTFFQFALNPIFLSSFGFIMYLNRYIEKQNLHKIIIFLLSYSVFTCLVYPILTDSINMVENIIINYILSIMLSIAINLIILFIYWRKYNKRINKK